LFISRFLYGTGLRLKEFIGLTYDDIKGNSGFLKIFVRRDITKNSAGVREIPLGQPLEE